MAEPFHAALVPDKGMTDYSRGGALTLTRSQRQTGLAAGHG